MAANWQVAHGIPGGSGVRDAGSAPLVVEGEGLRSIERLASVDRKTVCRYVAAATEVGLVQGGGEGRLDDDLLARVCETARPHRPDGLGAWWAVLRPITSS